MDEGRLVEIYRETVRPLHATVAGWTSGDRGRSEDIVQETYLRAVRAWRAQGVPDRPLAWLRTVARNLMVSEARRQRPEIDDERAEAASAPEPELAPEERLTLERRLGELPDDQARLLEAFHVEGLSTRDLALRHGISERAVEGRLRRARAALRARLSEDTHPEETAR